MLQGIRARFPTLLAAAGATAAVGGYAVWTATRPALAATPASALSPDEWRSLKLVHKEQLTKTTNPVWLFRFALPDEKQVVGLPVASCLLTRAPITKKDGHPGWVIRPYTPITAPDARGHFDLAIKVYKQPSPGKVSTFFEGLSVGDSADFKGPLPKLSLSDIAKRKEVGLVAGGTGLTPMLQVASEALRQGLPLKLSFIFANVSEDDIVMRKHLDGLAAKHDNFRVYYVVDKATSKSWPGGVGFITKDMLKQHLPPPGPDSLVLVCGPPGMMGALSGDKLPDKSQGPLTGLLKELGFDESNVYKF